MPTGLKDAANYEFISYEELGRGEPELVETGAKIITANTAEFRLQPYYE